MRDTRLATAALALALTAPLAAQETLGGNGAPATTVQAMPVDVGPAIDGRLDDVAWTLARPIDRLVQHSPFDGQPASEPTEVRIVFDAEALYIGARMTDSRVGELVFGEARRDASLDDTDAFILILDTFRDRQNAFVFGTSPGGIEFDGQVSREGDGGAIRSSRMQSGSGGGFNLNWDGSWEVATSVDGDGWTAEFRIPFSTLRYGAGAEQVWGLNFARHLRRRNEKSFWAPVPRQYDLYRVSLAGSLEGLRVPERRLVTLAPYVLASAHRSYAVPGADTDYPLEAGADAKLGLTPSLVLDLTYNTDFAQVEVDEQQVNLTRFNLFFPEKRPFFLENAGTFSFGTPQSVDLFFSRRIGIAPDGRPVPIVGGGRVSGRVGGFGVGVLNIQTEGLEDASGADLVAGNNYTVARVQRELPNRSRIGGIFINRFAPDVSGDYNRTYGIDGRIGIGANLTVDAYAAKTATPGLDGRDHTLSLRAEHSGRTWRLSGRLSEVGEDFNPEVGFLDRSGYRFMESSVMRYVRFPEGHWLRELRPHITYRGHHGFDGLHESGMLHVDSHVEFPNGAFFSPATNWVREGLREPFEISPGVVVPPGTYDNVEIAWQFNTDESADLSLTGGVNAGGFLSGSRKGANVAVTGRSGAELAAVLRLSHDIVTLPQGDFDVTLAGLRLAYAFTPRLYLQSLVQYASQLDEWSGNVRLGWLDTAGTGLFVVYNERQGLGTIEGPLDRALVIKYTRLFDFSR